MNSKLKKLMDLHGECLAAGNELKFLEKIAQNFSEEEKTTMIDAQHKKLSACEIDLMKHYESMGLILVSDHAAMLLPKSDILQEPVTEKA